MRTVLIAFFVVQLGLAQPPNPVAAKVRDLPIGGGGRLTVIMPDGSEYYGDLKSVDADSFSIREVDLKREITLRYVDVKNVLKGFGRRGFGGRRVHPRRSLITGLAIVGGLLVLVIVAGAADKS